MKVKYHSQFEHYKNSQGKAHPKDIRPAPSASATAVKATGDGNEVLTDNQGELLWT